MTDHSFSPEDTLKNNLRQEIVITESEIFNKTQKKYDGKSLKSSKKMSLEPSPKPKSAKNSITSVKTINEIEALNRETSQQVIRSVYSLISAKFPLTLQGSELSEKDQEDIQNFFVQKKLEFSRVLEEISKKKEKERKNKPKKLTQTSSCNELQYFKDIQLMKKKQKELKKDLIRRANEKIVKERNFVRKQKELEENRKKREVKQLQEYEKNLIIQNIENFYKDRIRIIKDHYNKELEIQKILEYEKKNYLSSVIKEQKERRLQSFSCLKLKYEKKLEKLKEKYELHNIKYA